MALTNLSQITTSGISTLADVSLNSITGVDATFTGNVSIGGTLTYDDVTNIDSVGLITARSGIRVLTGTATTALVVEGNARVTGILTVGTSSLTLDGTNNVVNVGTALTLGHTQGLQFHTQNLHSQGFDVNNVNATGIVTATTFIGNLTGTASNASGATGDFSIADKIVHTGDTNTAIRFPAADTITAETAGSERLRITSAGLVGIGSNSPTGKLEVAHDSQTDLLKLKRTSGNTGTFTISLGGANPGTIFSTSGVCDDFVFIAGSERLRITSAGNIGINTSTFAANGTNFKVSDGTISRLALDKTGANARKFEIGNFGTGLNFYDVTADAERLRILDDGSVIIGDSASDLSGTHTFMACGSRHAFQHDGNTGTYLSFTLGSADGDVDIEADARSGGYPDLTFTTNNDEQLRITSSGNIGIGLTNPQAQLDVLHGAIRLSRTATYTSHVEFGVTHAGSSDYGSLYFDNSNATGDYVFRTTSSNTERVRITSGGLLDVSGGIHVTENVTPTSGRGVEIFEAGTGVGQIQSYNRTSSGWDELRIKGSEVKIYTGTTNGLGLSLQSTQSTLYGTSDGILNIDTTDGRGAFIRFKENGTTKAWVGCSEGLGTGGDQDDLGIRAVDTIRLKAGSRNIAKFFSTGAVTFHVNSDSHETFRFSTQGANEAKLIMKDASSNDDIVLNTGGNSWINGNFGIGTNDPSNARLKVVGTITTTFGNAPLAIFGSGFAAGYYSTIGFGPTDSTWTVPPAGIGYVATSQVDAGKGDLVFGTRDNVANSSPTERLRITSEGHKSTNEGSIFHGSNDITDFTGASRNSYNNVSIRAGYSGGDSSPTNRTSAIKIYPVGTRNSTAGTLTGGIAWQHLDPNNGSWSTAYGAGAQIWMGAAIHDVPGQERDRFNLWMNDQTSGNSQPNNLAIEAYPNGIVRHPKVPSFLAIGGTALVNSQYTVIVGSNTEFNNGGHYSTSNGRFTAPINGIYHFTFWGLIYPHASGVTTIYYSRNGTQYGHLVQGGADSNSHTSRSGTIMMSMSAGDYAELRINRGSGSQNAYGSQWNMCGFLVG